MILIRLAALNQHGYCIMEGGRRQLDALEGPQYLAARPEWRVAERFDNILTFGYNMH